LPLVTTSTGKGGDPVKKGYLIWLLMVMLALYVKEASAQKQQHAGYADMKLSECNTCHKSREVIPNHDSKFVRDHRSLAVKVGSNCIQCHNQPWCLDCHQGGGIGTDLSADTSGRIYDAKSHRSDFVYMHPAKALENMQSCNQCHDQKYCNACHGLYKGGLWKKSHSISGAGQTLVWSAEHASEARGNLSSCKTCHSDGTVCLRCHSITSGWKIEPPSMDIKEGNIRISKTCRGCQGIPGIVY